MTTGECPMNDSLTCPACPQSTWGVIPVDTDMPSRYGTSFDLYEGIEPSWVVERLLI